MGKKTFLVFLTNVLYLGGLLAQVTIAPTNLFIDSGNQFGTYMVINGSEVNHEISVDFTFSYIKTDVNGNQMNVEDNKAKAAKFSIAENVRAFPRNFILTPGQRQIINLRVSPPNELADGTYWARIVTKSTPESEPVELAANDAVTARVGISFEQVTGLFYKNGEVSTGINVEEIRTQDLENNQLAVLTDLKRTGNSPFLGTITTSLLNSNNEAVRESFVSTSIYFDGTHKQILDLTGVPSGSYNIQITFETSRSDVSSSDIVPMETVTESIPYTIR